MKILKKTITFFVDAISVLVIVLAIVMLLSVVMTRSGATPNVFGFSFFRVMTGSMSPAIPTDSLVIVQQRDPQEIRVGDVISFYSADPALAGAVNTHRVTQITQENGALAFETKGDANYIPDKYLTRADTVIGVVVFTSWFLGKALRLIANPLVFLPLIILPLLIMMISNLIKTAKLSEKVLHQQEPNSADPPEAEDGRRESER